MRLLGHVTRPDGRSDARPSAPPAGPALAASLRALRALFEGTSSCATSNGRDGGQFRLCRASDRVGAAGLGPQPDDRQPGDGKRCGAFAGATVTAALVGAEADLVRLRDARLRRGCHLDLALAAASLRAETVQQEAAAPTAGKAGGTSTTHEAISRAKTELWHRLLTRSTHSSSGLASSSVGTA